MSDHEDRDTPDIPEFEGKSVHATALRIMSGGNLDIDDRVLRTDQIVRVVIEGRVNGIHHKVNEKTGELERIQTVKAMDVSFVPWDPTNPDDTGVL